MTRPKCLSWNETGAVDCFYRGLDSSVHRMTIKDSVVEEIENIGGFALGDVECVITAPRSVNCFIISENAALMTREMKNGEWEEWYSLDGPLEEVPACVSHSDGQIDCIGRDLNYSMYHKQYIPGEFKWRALKNIGGYTRQKPSVVYDSETNRITIYFEDWDHTPYYRRYSIDDDKWHSSSSIRSQKWYSPLSIVDWSNRTFYFSRGYTNEAVYFVYVKMEDPDDNLFRIDHYTFESTVLSEPECVSTDDFKADCFALGQDRTLLHSSLIRIGSGWTSWKVSHLFCIRHDLHVLFFLANCWAFSRSTHLFCSIQRPDSLLHAQLHTCARRDRCECREVTEAPVFIKNIAFYMIQSPEACCSFLASRFMICS